MSMKTNGAARQQILSINGTDTARAVQKVQAAFHNYAEKKSPLFKEQAARMAENAFTYAMESSFDGEGNATRGDLADNFRDHFKWLEAELTLKGVGENVKGTSAQVLHVADQGFSGAMMAWFAIKGVTVVAGSLMGAKEVSDVFTNMHDQVVLNFVDPHSVAVFGTIAFGKMTTGRIIPWLFPGVAAKRTDGVQTRLPSSGTVMAVYGVFAAMTNTWKALWKQDEAHVWLYKEIAKPVQDAFTRAWDVLSNSSTATHGAIAHLADPTVAMGTVVIGCYAAGRAGIGVGLKMVQGLMGVKNAAKNVAKEMDAIAPEEEEGPTQPKPPNKFWLKLQEIFVNLIKRKGKKNSAETPLTVMPDPENAQASGPKAPNQLLLKLQGFVNAAVQATKKLFANIGKGKKNSGAEEPAKTAPEPESKGPGQTPGPTA